MQEIVFAKRRSVKAVLLLLIMLVILGGCLAVAISAIVKSFPAPPHSPIKVAVLIIFCVPFCIFCLWFLVGVLGRGHYLETCPEGIIIGGFLCCRCTWDNVKDISATSKEVIGRYGARRTHHFIAINVHSARELHFSTRLHRFMSGLAIQDNRILISPMMCRLAVEVMLPTLLGRWRQAVAQTRESRA